MRFRLTWPARSGALAVLFIALLVTGISWAQEEGAPTSDYMANYKGADADQIGSTGCLTCHQDRKPGNAFTHLAIFDLDPNSANYSFGCEACHGPGGNHYGDTTAILDPQDMPQKDVTALCTKCHLSLGTFDRESWFQSGHDLAGLSCIACHSGHSANKDFLKFDDSNDLCFSCHSDQTAVFNMRSHHPVKEHQVGCDDCHNPHSGVYDKQLKADSDELCTGCHGDKKGPFLFDHDMSKWGNDNGCLTCHFAHGSNSDKLLQYPQRLCLECHSEMDATNHFAGTCWSTGCHTEIHGSDHSPFLLE